ncbi:unnamed protein product, partial [Didymodactylos carnosus]
PLKDIINELSREMSILQITQGNMGVITLNKMDCQWIEQLSRASLENEKDYFIKLNTPLNFNFLYVQSYLIRTYLLYCRINYEHIKGKYQCYTQRKPPITTINLAVNDERMIDIEEKTIDLWNARFDIPYTDQPKENSFNIFRNKTDDVMSPDPNPIFTPDRQSSTTPKRTTPIDLFKLKITLISFSILFEKSRIQVEQLASKTQNTRFAITFKDGKQTKYHCGKPEKFYMQLKKIFDEKKYDLNTIGIIDPNQILVDFMKTNVNNSLPIIEEEYHIKEKRLLISIILEK